MQSSTPDVLPEAPKGTHVISTISAVDILCLTAIQSLDPDILHSFHTREALLALLTAQTSLLRQVLTYAAEQHIDTLHGLAECMVALTAIHAELPVGLQLFIEICLSAWESIEFDAIASLLQNVQSLLNESIVILGEFQEKISLSENFSDETAHLPIPPLPANANTFTSNLIDTCLEPLFHSSEPPSAASHHSAILRYFLQSTSNALSASDTNLASAQMRKLFQFLSTANNNRWWHISQLPLAQLLYAKGDAHTCVSTLEGVDPKVAPLTVTASALALLAMLQFYHDVPSEWANNDLQKHFPEQFGEFVPFEYIELARSDYFERLALNGKSKGAKDSSFAHSELLLGQARMYAFLSKTPVHGSVFMQSVILHVRQLHDGGCFTLSVLEKCIHDAILDTAKYDSEGRQAQWILMLRMAIEDGKDGMAKIGVLCQKTMLETLFAKKAFESKSDIANAFCSKYWPLELQSTLLCCCTRVFMEVWHFEAALACLMQTLKCISQSVRFHAEDILFEIHARQMLSGVCVAMGETAKAVAIFAKAHAMAANLSLRAQYRRAVHAHLVLLKERDGETEAVLEAAKHCPLRFGRVFVEMFLRNENDMQMQSAEKVEFRRALAADWPIERVLASRENDVFGMFASCAAFANSVEK